MDLILYFKMNAAERVLSRSWVASECVIVVCWIWMIWICKTKQSITEVKTRSRIFSVLSAVLRFLGRVRQFTWTAEEKMNSPSALQSTVGTLVCSLTEDRPASITSWPMGRLDPYLVLQVGLPTDRLVETEKRAVLLLRANQWERRDAIQRLNQVNLCFVVFVA